ncbi:YdcF family protein [Streptacidiphilus sp. N1-12]|uniref:YdcF family protein n=2 Tax=Streptacidiphilus alkalitolerans TaxID=3342712 RepID=A0ABV6W8H7_9ACTN
MIAFAPAAVFLLFLAIGVLRDRRRLGNAVLLGLVLAALGLGAAVWLRRSDAPLTDEALLVLVLVPVVALGLLPLFLIANGVEMVRKEGRGLGNLLSLLAGIGLLCLELFLGIGLATGSHTLGRISALLVAPVGYLGFLFFCFVSYAFAYGRIRPRRKVDFVVVLGSGLIGGDRVPPLLAGRLERGRRLYLAAEARGAEPLLVTSGGQGPDEKLPEADAMADHLVERGVPAERIIREDRSRTTLENLENSRALMAERRPDYRCVVVTSNYHAFRAAVFARRAGVNGQVVGAPTAAYYWPSATIREFVAVLYAHWLVNLLLCALVTVLAAVGGWWR